ncbi:hypothetical protein [Allokutzneria multivorans]|uniref:hypothetical protein n=1 Tax=Allokutzneria multivorans TaxID=1142134 RepID=UPI0031F05F6F
MILKKHPARFGLAALCGVLLPLGGMAPVSAAERAPQVCGEGPNSTFEGEYTSCGECEAVARSYQDAGGGPGKVGYVCIPITGGNGRHSLGICGHGGKITVKGRTFRECT